MCHNANYLTRNVIGQQSTTDHWKCNSTDERIAAIWLAADWLVTEAVIWFPAITKYSEVSRERVIRKTTSNRNSILVPFA